MVTQLTRTIVYSPPVINTSSEGTFIPLIDEEDYLLTDEDDDPLYYVEE